MMQTSHAPREQIHPKAVAFYLEQKGYSSVEILDMTPLGQEPQEELKSYGYGRPLHIRFQTGTEIHHLVLRTMYANPFGHERRCDRARTLLMSQDTFASIPQHVQPWDCGVFDNHGNMYSIPSGEFFLVTDFVDGELYAGDLSALQNKSAMSAHDRARVAALAQYLAKLHQEPRSAADYVRSLRDTVGSGEGIFGILDSYTPEGPVSLDRLQDIESRCSRWRWDLRQYASRRARRTHGDFHPFNILFRSGADFSVLDCSRGGAGDPADDVTAMTINYLFFALCSENGQWAGALKEAWELFWEVYLQDSQDTEIFKVVPLYFTWRVSVLASPVWYPHIQDHVRNRLFTFVERLLHGEPFSPLAIEPLLAT
jgi:aminoglycoside phosphotransferase (APT) family kinase protein